MTFAPWIPGGPVGLCLLLLVSGVSAAASGSGCGGGRATEGRDWFGKTEFRRAADSFAQAIAADPECADAHFWLGRSLIRRYETAGPIFAGRFVHRARRELERAIELEPRRTEYAVELAGLYLDLPEHFDGGFERAASVLERVPADASTGDDLRQRLAVARRQQRGACRHLRRALIGLSTWAGYGMPWL